MLYRLYIDESGDHTYRDLSNLSNRYLGLTGCIMEYDYYRNDFCANMERFKQQHFPHSPDEPLILHRSEIVNRRGAFKSLNDPLKRDTFGNDLLRFFQQHQYTIITVVLDKSSHLLRYGKRAFDPYQYCLTLMLERYCGFLDYFDSRGDVVAEARGKREDDFLRDVYQRFFRLGSTYTSYEVAQKVLTGQHIKLHPKSSDFAGLQLADLLAYPCKQGVLCKKNILPARDDYNAQVWRNVQAKLNKRHDTGRIEGYGWVFIG